MWPYSNEESLYIILSTIRKVAGVEIMVPLCLALQICALMKILLLSSSIDASIANHSASHSVPLNGLVSIHFTDFCVRKNFHQQTSSKKPKIITKPSIAVSLLRRGNIKHASFGNTWLQQWPTKAKV